jgi:ribonucleoside-diphosphate reductase alpha chain
MQKNIYWLNEDSRKFLSKGYLNEGQTPESRIREIAETAEKYLGIEGFADKFEGYMHKGYYSLSTPVWTNYGNKKGLPVSCFGSYIPDDTRGICDKIGEVAIMSKMGGGTSAYFGDLRPRGSDISTGGKTDGPVRFMEWFDKTAQIISQGSARRGSFVAYLPVEHPDVKEFLQIRDEGNPIQEMSFAVTITDKWMQEMIDGDNEKRKIWGAIIKKRFESGFPYVSFIDNANNFAPQVYKDKGLKIKASNLCNEIQLFSDQENSFVCVISSINLRHWDEIVKTDAVETLIYFLDTVNEEFVIKTESEKYLSSAHNFAKTQRALGLGVLGWHSYLQKNMISFESLEAKIKNNQIFKKIREKCDAATIELAKILGEPELLKGYGRRNVTTMAIAPTTSSSFILGQVSPSIEPENSNYYVKDLAKGKFTYKNPYLLKLLEEKGKNNKEIWNVILTKGGSVQYLDFLSRQEKDVFKTFGEISQKEILIQAAARQKYIDQGQSLNVMIPHDVPAKDVSKLMIFAWEEKIKGLYYQRSSNPSQQLGRDILACKSCEA